MSTSDTIDIDPDGESPDLPCNVFVELVTDYLEGALAPDLRALVDEHLAICRGCATVLDQWRTVVRLSGRLSEAEVSAVEPEVRRSLMAAFRQLRSS